MLKPTPSKPGLFSVAFKRFSCLRGIAVVAFVSLVFAVTYLVSATPQVAYATTASTLNFQARLESSSGAIAPDGTYDVTFHLFNAATSSGSTDTGCSTDTNCLWEESYTYNSGPGSSDVRLHVANGYLTANLGSITAFSGINWDQPLYLTMDIGGTTSSGPITWDGQMNPRLPLTSVPYAFQTQNAEQLEELQGANTEELQFASSMTGSQTFVVPNMGGAGTYNLLTGPTGTGTTGVGVDLQSSSPGTQQSGSFNVSGTGIAGTLEAGTIDTASAGTLSIGTANATSIQFGHTFSFVSGANRSISIQTNGTTGNNLSLIAGSAGGTNNNGGNLILQGGQKTGTGTGGSVIVEPQTDSSSAFQVQNAASDQVLNIDTTQSSLVANPDFEGSMGFTNWTGVNTGGLSQNTTSSNVYYGNDSLAIALGATANSGATTSTYTSTLTAGTYSLSFMAKGSAALTGLAASLGSGTCTLNSTTVSTSYAFYYCAGVVTTGSPVVKITATTTGQTLYLDGVELDSGSAPLPFEPGSASIEGNLVVNGNQLQAANSQFALTVNEPQNIDSGGGGGILIQGNGNTIFQNALVVANAGGTDLLTINDTANATTIDGGSAFWGTSALAVNTVDSGATALTVSGTSGQTADIFKVQASGGATLLNVASNGNTGIGTENSSSSPVTLNVNGAIQQTGMSTGGTGGTAGQWAELGSCTLSGQFQMCQATVNILTDTGSASGVPNYNEPVQATLSMYVRENTYPTTPIVYLAVDGVDEQIPANDLKAVVTSNSGPIVVQVWGKLTGTFESWQYTPILNGSTPWTWTPNTALQTTDPATGAITSVQAIYGDTYANTLLVQPATDSTSVSQVQNASGSRMINVDTTGSSIMVGGSNPASVVSSTLATYEWDGTASNDPSLSVTPHTAGDLMIAAVGIPKNGFTITGMTGGGVASGGWHHVTDEADTAGTQYESLWEGTISTTGATTVAPTYSATPGVTTEIVADEFTAGLGSSTLWAVTASGTNAGTTTTINYPSLTSSQGNQLYWGYDECGGVASNGSTSGFTYHKTGSSNEIAYNPSLSADTTYAPTAPCATSPESGVGAIISAYTSNTSMSITGNTTVTSNSTAAFNVQSTGGSSLFDVDGTNNTVTMLQSAQVSTFTESPGVQDYAFTLANNIANPTEEVRWRINPSGANLESSGVDIWLSGWTSSNFSTGQLYFARGEISNGDLFLGNGELNGASNSLSGSNGVTLLVLDNTASGTSTDPTTAFPGSMYYNANMGAFRCYQNGEWRNCVSAVQSWNTNGLASASTSTSTSYSNFPGGSTSITFTKAADSTNLVVYINVSAFLSSGTSTVLGVGVSIDGTNYNCSRLAINPVNTHTQASCTVIVPGGTGAGEVPAGSQTAQILWRRVSGSGTIATDGSTDWSSMTVQETD